MIVYLQTEISKANRILKVSKSIEYKEINLLDKIDVPSIVVHDDGHVHMGSNIYPIVDGSDGFIYLKLTLLEPIVARYSIETGIIDKEYTKSRVNEIKGMKLLC